MYSAIIDPIAKVLGYILDIMFGALHAMGIGNIAIAIVLFTLLVKVLMLPLTVKQQKMTKLTAVMNPEIQAIQKKYKDKRGDQNAVAKMQEETKAVYEKYGVSQMGGCIQLIIQFPILMALYRVFQCIPLYVSQLKVFFMNVLNGADGVSGIMSNSNYSDIMSQNFSNSVDWSNTDAAIRAINAFTTDQWRTLGELFPNSADVITNSLDALNKYNSLGSINLSQNPEITSIAIIIPILAGISQFLSVKISQGKQVQADSDNPAAASMKMMTIVMPLMSVFIGFSVPAGLGIYWIATAVFQTLMQIIINRYYDNIGVDAIVKKNVDKRNKKRAKKGLPPEKIAKNASLSTKTINDKDKNSDRIKSLKDKKEANDKRVKDILDSTQYYKSAKPGSLAEKAGMVSKYNDKNKK